MILDESDEVQPFHFFRVRIRFEEILPVLRLKRKESGVEIFAVLSHVSQRTTETEEDSPFWVRIQRLKGGKSSGKMRLYSV